MRFGLIHRIMTDGLATLGLLALVTSGELDRWVSIFILVGLALALAVPERFQDRAPIRQLGVVAPVALLALQAARALLGENLLEVAVEFAAALQVVRLATRRGAAHDQQVIVLSLLHLIAGTVIGGGLAYGLCFIGFLIVAPGALVLSHLRREVEGNYRQGARDRTGLPVDVPRILRSRRVIGRQFLAFTCLLSIPIFIFTAGLFVLFPRVGLSLLLINHSRPERMIGFADRVDLGGVGKLRSDPTIAMRIEYPKLPPEPPPRLALYLRGTAFDHYDGRSWQRSRVERTLLEQHGEQVALIRLANPERDLKVRIDLEPIDPPVLFLPPRAIALGLVTPPTPLPGSRAQVFGAAEGGLEYKAPDGSGLRYDVYLARPNERAFTELGSYERQRYLALPDNVTPRVRELAAEWTLGAGSDENQARAVESRLRKDYRYDLESPSGAAENPLDHFLFDSRRGHCEFYSTAMAVMLRSVGIPTRNVTGFIGGTFNRFGRYYAVRQGDAHSWVEVYLNDRGWTRFDPTPPGDAAPRSEITGFLAYIRDFVEAAAQRWNRHVVGYDLKQQVSLFRTVQDRYTELKRRSPALDLALGSPRRALLLLLGVGLILGGLYWLKRSRKTAPSSDDRSKPDAAAALQVIELYRALESALKVQGVPRPVSTPPLSHARALSEMGHPLGEQALKWTEVYLEVRFGERALTEGLRRDFARAARALKQFDASAPRA